MSGTEIKLVAQWLVFFLKSLPENCYFNVARFSTNCVLLFEKPLIYSEENAWFRIALAENLEADIGGTNLALFRK